MESMCKAVQRISMLSFEAEANCQSLLELLRLALPAVCMFSEEGSTEPQPTLAPASGFAARRILKTWPWRCGSGWTRTSK